MSTYLTHKSYREVENLADKGIIDRPTADKAHELHKVLSDTRDIICNAEEKMMAAIRQLNTL